MGFILLAPRLDTNAETERDWYNLLFNVYQYMYMEISYTFTNIKNIFTYAILTPNHLLYPRSTDGGMGVYWIHVNPMSFRPSVRPSVRL